ncbi:putative lipase atg15 [Stygiomarasmius scandens]|uniref:triacylglycerol lipase n=1 Tax=Marasmiellus scandens TaxID=2682957 RepID=A0ABR1IX48_9AGAR
MSQHFIHGSKSQDIVFQIENKETLLTLAKMGDPQWYELESNWTVGFPFGWEPDADGFRGHVFATPDNSTAVLSIKGTSAGLFGGGGPMAKKDKLNDNLLYSCYRARVDWTWPTVCGCYWVDGNATRNVWKTR